MEQNRTEREFVAKKKCAQWQRIIVIISESMKECVAGKQRTRPMEIQWQNERDGTIKRAALGMFIIQEEKQKITISHNMLNSLNDTIAHTAHWRCTRACAQTPSPAAAQLLGPGCIVIYVWYRMQRAICFRPTNRNPFWIAQAQQALNSPNPSNRHRWWWWWWSARTSFTFKTNMFSRWCWMQLLPFVCRMNESEKKKPIAAFETSSTRFYQLDKLTTILFDVPLTCRAHNVCVCVCQVHSFLVFFLVLYF